MAKFAAGFGLTQRLKPSSHLGEEAVTGPFGFPDTRSSNGFNGFYVPRHRYHVPREARVTPLLFGKKSNNSTFRNEKYSIST